MVSPDPSRDAGVQASWAFYAPADEFFGKRTFDKAVRMRSVRCDACGTKALMAASQCPKCGHLFEVRDGFGDTLPLAHCPSCDSFYPATAGSCKWCRTTLIPEKARKGDSSRLRWVAAGAFAVAVALGLLARDPGPRAGARPRVPDSAKSNSAAPAAHVDSVAPAAPIAVVDTTSRSDIAAPPKEIVTDVSTAAPSAAPIRTSEPRRASPWVTMMARQWVTVRAGAQGSAHIVASVGPNARVQLGETRGAWRRIKSRGIAGWVEVHDGAFVEVRSSPRRARRIADR
jgi:hypothetical protein